MYVINVYFFIMYTVFYFIYKIPGALVKISTFKLFILKLRVKNIYSHFTNVNQSNIDIYENFHFNDKSKWEILKIDGEYSFIKEEKNTIIEHHLFLLLENDERYSQNIKTIP